MSFTDAEKSKMLFFLGYSVFEDDGPAIRAINSLDAREARAGFIVRDLLVKIEQTLRELHESLPLASAIEDGSLKIRAHYTQSVIRSLGRTYVKQLSRWIKVRVGDDIFSSGGGTRQDFYSGDPSENRIDAESGVPTVGT